ncbi:MAG: FAD:protein FMN transferase [Thermodesulfobacteriota bacterium]
MKNFMDRRAFIQGLFVLSAGWAARGWAAPMSTVPFSPSLVQVSETRNLMATFVTITLLHSSPDQAQTVLGAAFHKMENWIQIFNRHESGSYLTYLNERGFLKDPPPELLHVLREAKAIHSRTRGVFDVTIKPVLDLYESQNESGRIPTSAAIQEALGLVGISGLKIDPQRTTIKEGMGITLDGIAKGTIVDKTITFLKGKGIRHALVAAGGDIRVFGGRKAKVPWRIAVYDPKNKSEFPETISLSEGAVSTSGNYMVYFDREKVHHHILSPENGVSPTWSVSSTIVAPTSEEADALATSLMLLSPEEGMSLINKDRGLAAMLITREGKRIHSLRWPGTSESREGRNDRA